MVVLDVAMSCGLTRLAKLKGNPMLRRLVILGILFFVSAVNAEPVKVPNIFRDGQRALAEK